MWNVRRSRELVDRVVGGALCGMADPGLGSPVPVALPAAPRNSAGTRRLSREDACQALDPRLVATDGGRFLPGAPAGIQRRESYRLLRTCPSSTGPPKQGEGRLDA